MVGGSVQCVEIVMCAFHLGTFYNIKTHTDEYFSHLVFGLSQRMEHTDVLFLCGKCYVDFFGSKAGVHELLFQLGFLFFYCSFDILTYDIGSSANDGTFICGKAAHASEDCGKLALFAEIFDTCGFKRRTILHRGNGGCRICFDFFQFVKHDVFLI